jgi:hypothetical protein
LQAIRRPIDGGRGPGVEGRTDVLADCSDGDVGKPVDAPSDEVKRRALEFVDDYGLTSGWTEAPGVNDDHRKGGWEPPKQQPLSTLLTQAVWIREALLEWRDRSEYHARQSGWSFRAYT